MALYHIKYNIQFRPSEMFFLYFSLLLQLLCKSFYQLYTLFIISHNIVALEIASDITRLNANTWSTLLNLIIGHILPPGAFEAFGAFRDFKAKDLRCFLGC